MKGQFLYTPTYIPNTTYGKMLEDNAEKNGRKPYLYFEDEVVSYEEVNERVNIIAGGFSDIGVSKGSRVAMLLSNHPNYLYMIYALGKLGAVPITLNVSHKGSILEYMINLSDATILVSDKQFVDNIKAIEGNLSNITRLIVHPDNEGVSGLHFTTSSYQELLTKRAIAGAVEMEYYAPFLMLYTSGTTGLSKGVQFTYNQSLFMVKKWAEGAGLTSNDVLYSWTPIFHTIGITVPLMALAKGGSLALVKTFSLHRFWDDIKKYKVTFCCNLPMLHKLLIEQPEKPDDADNTLRMIMEGPIPQESHREFERRFNLRFIENYGLTEFNPIALGIEDKVGTPGKGIEDVEIRIFDDYDNELPPHKVGEIVVRPLKPGIMMSSGYYKAPEKTVEVFRNLWLHTGDVGYRDEEGYLYFRGRKKDMIRRRGENISSAEIEGILVNHPNIQECAAVPVPSEFMEDDVKVVVRLRDREGKTLSPEELLHFCEDNMAYFMVPRYVEFVKSFPVTATGRIRKDDLKTVTDKTWDRDKVGYKLKRK